MPRYVYDFSETKNPQAVQKLLGNKGAQLAEMTAIGLPVPSGFTIATTACAHYFLNKSAWPKTLDAEVKAQLSKLEKKMGKKLGDQNDPLLVSVRSGSYVSMPGMMETILNLGLNDASVRGLAQKTGNFRFAFDCYRRLIQMFGDVCMNVPMEHFEKALRDLREKRKVQFDYELSSDDLKDLVQSYKKIVSKHSGRPFPQDPREQLQIAINAVFDSWNSERAIAYRRINKIPDEAGTGVNIQAMVFGNKGPTSGTGVAFTRNPSNGEKVFYGEFLMNAQGEDVVAGIRTPEPIANLAKVNPAAHKQLVGIVSKLEKHYRDMQDFEFTIEEGKLFMLQTRAGKRTAPAAVRIAVDMVREKMISKEEAVLRVKPDQLDQLLHKQLDPAAMAKETPVAKGLPASPGAAVGQVVFDSKDAVEMVHKNEGLKLVLVRPETSPEDIEGMHVAQGILTSTGGLTSHAAVVARGMGKPCVCGTTAVHVDVSKNLFRIKTPTGEKTVKKGDYVSIDGATGEVFIGTLSVIDPVLSKDFEILMGWADSMRTLRVRANADTPDDAKKARGFGAEGIGLCRTEHMFFEPSRILPMREMILSDSADARKAALEKLLPFQQKDFEGIFEAMDGLPVIIRLLDPPLHEFLPQKESEIRELAQTMGVTVEKIHHVAHALHEFNPMLGFRGCRLPMVYPEIAQMQARAIFQAALAVKKRGIKPLPEIEVPLVGFVRELEIVTTIIRDVARQSGAQGSIHYKVGTMIEIPRACVAAGELAKSAEFFSFGTNDLTQTTLGFSRDDAGRFIGTYLEKKVFVSDPFASIDQSGVGELMKMAVAKARAVQKNVDIGICGEHGGDPASVEFCHAIGLSNVSCSPYRVPIARLAAAQAAIKEKKTGKKK